MMAVFFSAEDGRRQRYRKFTATALAALHGDVATMSLHYLPYKVQPQAEA